jgi:hypothetical protein
MTRIIIALSALLIGLSLILSGCADNSAPADGEGSVATAPENTDPEIPDSVLMARGMEITTTAFKKLSGSLKQAISDSGVPGALQYCNLMAWPLLDTVARSHGVKLRRTALRVRNPSNRPEQPETSILNAFDVRNQAGEKPRGKLERTAGMPTTFYRPILLQEGCLPCHGSPNDDIATEDFNLIRSLYPADEAISFQVGELRGMWVVENIEGAIAFLSNESQQNDQPQK